MNWWRGVKEIVVTLALGVIGALDPDGDVSVPAAVPAAPGIIDKIRKRGCLMYPLAYLAGPYRSAAGLPGIEANILAAGRIARDLWQMGFAVICPHKNTGLMDGAIPDQGWLEGDFAMISRCDVIVMMPNWKESSGARAEHEFALQVGVPIFYWAEDSDRRALSELGRRCHPNGIWMDTTIYAPAPQPEHRPAPESWTAWNAVRRGRDRTLGDICEDLKA